MRSSSETSSIPKPEMPSILAMTVNSAEDIQHDDQARYFCREEDAISKPDPAATADVQIVSETSTDDIVGILTGDNKAAFIPKSALDKRKGVDRSQAQMSSRIRSSLGICTSKN